MLNFASNHLLVEMISHIKEYLDAYIILAVVVGIIWTTFTDLLSPANSFLLGTLILIIGGIADMQIFLTSFSNAQVITIFILIFITVAIRRNTNVDALFDRFFKNEVSPNRFILKMSVIVAFFSSFLNNTPIVAMLTNNVQRWADQNNMSPSKFLIPLSYAAILGGMITVIGTSTNLVLMGLLSSNGEPMLNYLDFLVVGSSVCAVGILYLIVFSMRVLPDRTIALKQFTENRGQYIHEVELKSENDLIGKTVLEAGLKNLKGIYLVEISRNGEILTPVEPQVIIEKGDHLYFTGDTEQLVQYVESQDGLTLPSQEKLHNVGTGNIVEVVVAANSKLAGSMVKDSLFRQQYDASIIGIHRNGERVSGKIGYVRLKSGDLLLLLTGNDFENRIEQDKSLYLMGQIRKAWRKPTIKNKEFYYLLQAITAVALLMGSISFFLSLVISLFLLVWFKYLNIDSIKRNFNFDLLIVLACSLTLGKVFIDTGAADLVSDLFLDILPKDNVKFVLTGLFGFTVLLTSLVTNIAAVSIAFPVAYALCHHMNIDGGAFYLTIAFGASAAFLTPMGYQTNMMVYGPGGYKGADFLRAGLPLLVIYSLSSLLMIFWWFEL